MKTLERLGQRRGAGGEQAGCERLAGPCSCVHVAAPPGEGDVGLEGRCGREGVAADRCPVTGRLSYFLAMPSWASSLLLGGLASSSVKWG